MHGLERRGAPKGAPHPRPGERRTGRTPTAGPASSPRIEPSGEHVDSDQDAAGRGVMGQEVRDAQVRPVSLPSQANVSSTNLIAVAASRRWSSPVPGKELLPIAGLSQVDQSKPALQRLFAAFRFRKPMLQLSTREPRAGARAPSNTPRLRLAYERAPLSAICNWPTAASNVRDLARFRPEPKGASGPSRDLGRWQ